MKTEIKELPLSDIKPYWRNPRTGNVQTVKDSIKLYGYNQFIVVDKDYIIIVGHTRYKALQELAAEDPAWNVVTCIVTDMDKTKAKEYRIVDNKTGDQSEWILGNLSSELKELDEDTMTKFFPQEEWDKLVKESLGSINFEEVTEAAIAQRDFALSNTMVDSDTTRRTIPKIVICPKCSHEFEVS
jgi:ParB family transcriptional regulator, chromosome partitioning protein